MVKIKIKREYWVKEGARGKMTLCLPAKEDGWVLIPELGQTGLDLDLFEDDIRPTWGYKLDENWRFREKIFKASNFEELEQKMDKAEEEVIEKLYKLLDKYDSLSSTKPEDREYEVVLR